MADKAEFICNYDFDQNEKNLSAHQQELRGPPVEKHWYRGCVRDLDLALVNVQDSYFWVTFDHFLSVLNEVK